MKRLARTLPGSVAAVVSMMMAASVYARGDPYDLRWYTVDSGGETFSTGGTYELGGTIGQPDAGSPLTGGNYALTGGFWSAAAPGGVTTPSVLYVDSTAAGSNEGSSWTNAFNELQDALAAAAPGQEIWVAAGTYVPGGDAEATFQLLDGVELYGGFAGFETSLAQRDPVANPTILSGGGVYHVVTAIGVGPATVLDGFTITGGNANGTAAPDDRGGGVYVEAASPTIRNCAITQNSAFYGGGGIYATGGSPLLAKCTFTQNSAVGSADGNAGGGGVYCEYDGHATIVNCRFVGNTAQNAGAGLFCRENSDATVVNCDFDGNLGAAGGALCPARFSDVVLTNCTFRNNAASFAGGLAYIYKADPTFRNCIAWGNTAPQGPAFALYSCPSNLTVAYSDIQGGLAAIHNVDSANCSVSWGMGNLSLDPQLAPDGTLTAGSPCIDAGDNGAVPADVADLDADGDTSEALPLDLAGAARFSDDPDTPDTGAGTSPIVDLGAFESVPD